MKLILVLVTIIAVMNAPSAFAEDDHDKARRAVQEGRIVPLTEVLDNVEEQFSGRIIEVQLMEDPAQADRLIYEIEVVSEDGRLIEIFYDARNGNPIALGGQGLSDGDADR